MTIVVEMPRLKPNSLDGETVIVTGAGGGTGCEVARKDKTLHAEPPSYADHANRTCYCLLPGVWWMDN